MGRKGAAAARVPRIMYFAARKYHLGQSACPYVGIYASSRSAQASTLQWRRSLAAAKAHAAPRAASSSFTDAVAAPM
jgi:hypothetical protein